MTHRITTILLLITLTGLMTACTGVAPIKIEATSAPTESQAAETSAEAGIMVMEPFAQLTTENGAIYLTLMNQGEADDSLVSVETDVAKSVELHETTIDENDVMHMSPLDSITIPAGDSAVLEPGGMHVMLMDIQQELNTGDTFDITLNFDNAEPQTVAVEVGTNMAMDHSQMEHGEDGMSHEGHGDMAHDTSDEEQGMSHEGHGDMEHGDSMMLKFAFKAGADDVVCGQDYAELGAEATTTQISDARFYVSNIRLINTAGEETPFELEQDGLWQHMNTALLDFEDGSNACSEIGTAPKRNVVVGTAPKGEYSGVAFNLGIPSDMNHLDVTAAPSPLNIGALWWNWQYGYKFARIDLLTNSPEQGNQWFIHLGSIGCESEAGTIPPETACTAPNLPEIKLTNFDMQDNVIVADLAGLLDGVDISDSTPEPVGCMSGLEDPDCSPLMSNLGLDQASGSCADDCANQKFFRVDSADSFEMMMGEDASFEGLDGGGKSHHAKGKKHDKDKDGESDKN